jgi:hypothetical protein
MNCVTNKCGQHSERCPTPWTCGKYSKEANYDTSPHRVHYVGDEPVTTPEATVTATELVLAAVVVVPLVAVVGWFLWANLPVLVAMVTL